MAEGPGHLHLHFRTFSRRFYPERLKTVNTHIDTLTTESTMQGHSQLFRVRRRCSGQPIGDETCSVLHPSVATAINNLFIAVSREHHKTKKTKNVFLLLQAMS